MCGLIGYCGSKPGDPQKIKLLLMFNMDRGEHATGWAINNTITKDSVKVAKFLETNEAVLTPEDENFTVIAHARKASIGNSYVKELAHPFGIYSDGEEKTNYDLILAMNGTLTNTEEMAKHWEVSFTAMNSDTQILSKLIAKLGPKEYKKALESYCGTATLLFFSPKNPNVLMVYKDPERELYYWQKEKDEIYISSIEGSLYAIGALKVDVKPFTNNHLYKILKGKITKEELISRTPMFPVHVVRNKTKFCNNEYDNYDSEGCSANLFKTNNFINKELLRKTSHFEMVDVCDNKNHTNRSGSDMYLVRDQYFRNGHPVTGEFYITKSGKIKSGSASDLTGGDKYWFLCGYMMKDEKSYDKLVDRCKDESGNYQSNKFKVIPMSDMIECFMYPVLSIVADTAGKEEQRWVLNNEWAAKKKKRGDTIMLDMFLSEHVYELLYEGLCIEKAHKDVCTFVGSELKNRPSFEIDEIERECSRENSISFLMNLLSSTTAPHLDYYFTRVRTDLWKENDSDKVREYFSTMFLEIMLNEGVIRKETFQELSDQGNKDNWRGPDFITALEDSIRLFKTRAKESEIRIGSQNEINKLGDEKIISILKDKNKFFSTTDFNNVLYDAKCNDLETMSLMFVRDPNLESSDFRYFFEAVLLGMNTVGEISNSELIKVIDQDNGKLKECAEVYYKSWKETVDKAAERQQDGEITLKNEENWNKEDVEKDFKERLIELIAHMREIVTQGEILDDSLISTKTDKIVGHLKSQIEFLEKRIKIEKLLEK